MFMVSWACSIIALLLLWAVYPADFNFGQATAASYKFYEAQRVGNLPPSNSIPWRGPALLYERSPKFGFDDLTGGWLNGGAIGAFPPSCTSSTSVSPIPALDLGLCFPAPRDRSSYVSRGDSPPPPGGAEHKCFTVMDASFITYFWQL